MHGLIEKLERPDESEIVQRLGADAVEPILAMLSGPTQQKVFQGAYVIDALGFEEVVQAHHAVPRMPEERNSGRPGHGGRINELLRPGPENAFGAGHLGLPRIGRLELPLVLRLQNLPNSVHRRLRSRLSNMQKQIHMNSSSQKTVR